MKSYKNIDLKITGKYVPPGERMPGERIRRLDGVVCIDFSVFKKTPEERLKLRIAKSKSKKTPTGQ